MLQDIKYLYEFGKKQIIMNTSTPKLKLDNAIYFVSFKRTALIRNTGKANPKIIPIVFKTKIIKLPLLVSSYCSEIKNFVWNVSPMNYKEKLRFVLDYIVCSWTCSFSVIYFYCKSSAWYINYNHTEDLHQVWDNFNIFKITSYHLFQYRYLFSPRTHLKEHSEH